MDGVRVKKVVKHTLNLQTGEKTERKLEGEELKAWLIAHGYKQADKEESKEDVTT